MAFIPRIILLFITIIALSGCLECKKESKITQLENFKPPARQTILIGGCFDILHPHHISFLKKAKQTEKYLIIALESDESIIKLKKRYPVNEQIARANILIALKYVDEVVLLPPLQGFNEYFTMVKKINPNFIGITEPDKQKENKNIMANRLNAKLITVSNLIEGDSTTSIINKIRSYHQENIAIKGKIILGKGEARRLGVPTFNVKYHTEQKVEEGVHLCKAKIKGIVMPSICYYDNNRNDIIEVHILQKNINKLDELEVVLIEFLRPKIKFSSFDELTKQIKLDLTLANIKHSDF